VSADHAAFSREGLLLLKQSVDWDFTAWQSGAQRLVMDISM
jgi:hypothetical protein